MYTRVSIIVLSAVVALCACNRRAPVMQDADTRPVISVEEKPTMIRVISRQSGREITPGIDIFADGRCRVRTLNGDEYSTSLKSSTVQSLLSFLEREGLFSISDESIERAIDRELQPIRTELPGGGVGFTSRGRALVTDLNYTGISARLGTNSVRIYRYALEFEIEHYPTVKELRTVHRCVQRVYEVAGK